MNIKQALYRAKLQTFAGWGLTIIAATILLLGLLKSLYWQIENTPRGIASPLTDAISLFISWIFDHTSRLYLLWNMSPALTWSPLLTEGNLPFIAWVSAFTLGLVVRDSGNRLWRRVNAAIQDAQKTLWGRELSGEAAHARALSVSFSLAQKDQWFTRPAGILLLTVIGGILVNFISKFLGLY